MGAQFSKIFTPAEASKRLPLIKKIVEDILSKGKRLHSLIETRTNSAVPECIKLQDQIEEHMEELERLGCFYKDWNFQIGLVDFPAIIDQEQVFLCWRSDERELRWYHGLEEGYPGRKLIPQNFLQSTSASQKRMP